MNKLAVNIQICGRVYPIKVRAGEESDVRAAGKLINQRLKAYREKFGIQDSQDLLAMVAFDCLVETTKIGQESKRSTQYVSERITVLSALLDQTV